MQDSASEIIGSYAKWHYSHALKEFVNISRNYIRFLAHFFSLNLLLKTLFSPWRRLHENYKGGLEVGNFISSLVVNFLMRLVGLVFRVCLLLIGFLSLSLAVLILAGVFVVWVLFPIFIIALLSSAVILILSAL